jgi:hypothetical protein
MKLAKVPNLSELTVVATVYDAAVVFDAVAVIVAV